MKRTIRRLAMLCLAASLLAGGCTTRSAAEQYVRETPAPTAAPTPVPALTPTPVPTPSPSPTPTPTPCPHLSWTDGVCDGCGAACPHEKWENGVCTVCGLICTHPAHDPETRQCTRCGQPVPHDYVKNVCRLCGEEPEFLEENVPRELFKPCAHKGTVEKVEYTTMAFFDEEEGKNPDGVKKTLYVYLPYNYDPEGKYDVLVLLHGIACTEKYWLVDKQEYKPMGTDEVRTADLLDNLIDRGYCRPLIVVSPTFYEDSGKMEEYWRRTDQPCFQQEVREDVLPLIAEKYATWAESGELEDISAQRQHFGIAGLSMGSIYIYTGFLGDCLDLFGWFGCFSGSDGNMSELARQLNSAPDADYPIYYFYNSIGRYDDYYDLHLGQYRSLLERAKGLTEGENAAFTVIADVGHKYAAWSPGLYNFLQIAFSPAEIGAAPQEQ